MKGKKLCWDGEKRGWWDDGLTRERLRLQHLVCISLVKFSSPPTLFSLILSVLSTFVKTLKRESFFDCCWKWERQGMVGRKFYDWGYDCNISCRFDCCWEWERRGWWDDDLMTEILRLQHLVCLCHQIFLPPPFFSHFLSVDICENFSTNHDVNTYVHGRGNLERFGRGRN